MLNLEPFAEKIRACGWPVREVDGQSVEELESTLKAVPFKAGKPSWVIAHTVKRKGVSFLENTVACHYGHVSDEQLALALRELGVNA